jgi:hypothetical protein
MGMTRSFVETSVRGDVDVEGKGPGAPVGATARGRRRPGAAALARTAALLVSGSSRTLDHAPQ